MLFTCAKTCLQTHPFSIALKRGDFSYQTALGTLTTQLVATSPWTATGRDQTGQNNGEGKRNTQMTWNSRWAVGLGYVDWKCCLKMWVSNLSNETQGEIRIWNETSHHKMYNVKVKVFIPRWIFQIVRSIEATWHSNASSSTVTVRHTLTGQKLWTFNFDSSFLGEKLRNTLLST